MDDFYITSDLDTWKQIADAHGITEGQLRAANSTYNTTFDGEYLSGKIELEIPPPSDQDVVVDKGGNVIHVDRSQWTDWNIVQGHNNANNIVRYDSANDRYVDDSGETYTREQLVGETLNDGFAEEIPEPIPESEPEPVELESVPRLHLMQTEANLWEFYWYDYWITKFKAEGDVKKEVPLFDINQAQDLFVQELMPQFKVLQAELAYETEYPTGTEQVNLEPYSDLTREAFEAFTNPESGYLSGMDFFSELQETGIDPNEPIMQAFIENMYQQNGMSGLITTMDELMTLTESFGVNLDNLMADAPNAITGPVSPFGRTEDFIKAYQYLQALANGDELPFIPFVPPPNTLLGDAMYGVWGTDSQYTDDPEFWFEYATLLQHLRLENEFRDDFSPSDELLALASAVGIDSEGFNFEDYGAMAVERVLSDLGKELEELTVDELTVYISEFAERYPEYIETMDPDSEDAIEGSSAYIGGTEDEARLRELEAEASIENLVVDDELRGLIDKIQGLPDEILGVSTGEVKSAFASILNSDYEQPIGTEEDNTALIKNALYAQVARIIQEEGEEQTKKDLLELLFTVAGFGTMGAGKGVQFGLAGLELLLTKNPTGLVAELLPEAFEGLGRGLLDGADEAADLANDVQEFIWLNKKYETDAILKQLNVSDESAIVIRNIIFETGDVIPASVTRELAGMDADGLRRLAEVSEQIPNVSIQNRLIINDLYTQMGDVDPSVLRAFADMEIDELTRLKNAADYRREADNVYNEIRKNKIFGDKNPPITVAVTRNKDGVLVISVSGEGGRGAKHTLEQNDDIYYFLEEKYPDAILIEPEIPHVSISGDEVAIPRYVARNESVIWEELGLSGGVAHAEPLMIYSLGEYTDEVTAIGISNRYICDRCLPFFESNWLAREGLGKPGITVAYYDESGRLVLFPNLSN